ncbi:MAG: BamA/TamA family outer membrane protein, partial [Phycisphaerae bacterium]|nr:BamA/TamA family outer membrane protein [Phycisphaerae bacterium]
EVIVRGNALTQDKVFRRQLRGLEPGRLLDTTGIEVSERRIRGTALAREAKITVLGEEDDEARDVLVEIEEAGTGSISFGAAVSSDSGVFGAIELTQRNFDIQDAPESWGEFFSGRAFRGAGQYFSVSLQPGNEFSRYQVNFREPYLLESDYFLDTNFFLFNRDREEWEEERVGGTLGLGKRFGDVWSASVRGRYETVDLSDFDPDVPVDAVAVAGEKDVDSIGFFVTRSTVKTDRSFLPYEGTRVSGGIEQVGAFGNDFDFTRLTAQYRAHLTLDEDFFERKTTLTFRMNTGYIPDAGSVTVTPTAGPPAVISDIPLYERFYAGGHRTFRGFEFRGIGPRGIRNDLGVVGNDPVGGEFLFLMGAEYNFPVAEDFLRAVFFIDSGTIQDDIRFSDYRVTVGAGIRMRVPLLGSAPFAFDLAIPLADELGDETQVFSFDIALPF